MSIAGETSTSEAANTDAGTTRAAASEQSGPAIPPPDVTTSGAATLSSEDTTPDGDSTSTGDFNVVGAHAWLEANTHVYSIDVESGSGLEFRDASLALDGQFVVLGAPRGPLDVRDREGTQLGSFAIAADQIFSFATAGYLVLRRDDGSAEHRQPDGTDPQPFAFPDYPLHAEITFDGAWIVACEVFDRMATVRAWDFASTEEIWTAPLSGSCPVTLGRTHGGFVHATFASGGGVSSIVVFDPQGSIASASDYSPPLPVLPAGVAGPDGSMLFVHVDDEFAGLLVDRDGDMATLLSETFPLRDAVFDDTGQWLGRIDEDVSELHIVSVADLDAVRVVPLDVELAPDTQLVHLEMR